MRRRRRWPHASLFLACLLWSTLIGSARAASGDEVAALPTQRLVLAATFNGRTAPEPVLVRRQGPMLWMRSADLRAMGVRFRDDAPEVALATIAELNAAIDDGAQTIALTQGTSVQHVRLYDPPATESAPVTRSDWGAAINYDLTASRARRVTVAGGLLDAVVFGPHGHFYAGAVVTTRADRGQRAVTRLDSGFTTGDPGSARRITVGDLITGATEQSRPVRLGGVQIATDFDLRPDLITFPVPAIGGSAAVPSALDLVVNGSRRAAGEIKAGQFAISDVPVQTGVNTITVAVRDALGRETRQTVSTYVSRALLRPGLTAYSLEAGFVRTGYATSADQYRDFAGVASLRTGVSERLTLETHAEVAGRVGNATAGASLGLGGVGLLSASAGVSVVGDRRGTQLAIGYERVGRPVSIAARYVRHSAGWYDLASDGGAVTRAHSASLTLGFDLARFGTLGVAAIDQGRGRIVRRVAGSPARATLPSSTFVSTTYSVRLAHRLNLVANAGVDFRTRRSGYISIGALLVLGRRSSSYAGVLARAGQVGGTAEWSQTAIEPGDWGYRVGTTAGGIGRVAADVTYQGTQGFYAAQVERTNGESAARISARGAVVIDGSGVLFADRLSGSFAVVDTGAQGGVPVFRDNRRVGVTNRRGKLVVPDLRAWEATKISLDPLLLDDAVLHDGTEHWIRPAARTGVPVRFGLRVSRAARVQLIDVAGRPIPAGARATTVRGEVPVGMDGELYLEDVAGDNAVTVALRDGSRCVAEFAGATRGAPIQRIGPVTCRPIRIAAR